MGTQPRAFPAFSAQRPALLAASLPVYCSLSQLSHRPSCLPSRGVCLARGCFPGA